LFGVGNYSVACPLARPKIYRFGCAVSKALVHAWRDPNPLEFAPYADARMPNFYLKELGEERYHGNEGEVP
jgi:hypothetical protein